MECDIRWVRKRSDLGTVFYEGFSLNHKLEDTLVASVIPLHKPVRGKKFVAKYLDHVPFRCYNVKNAKANLEAIHASTSR